jgi:hypothetical protein
MLHRALLLFIVAASFASAQEAPPAPAPLWKKCGVEISWMSDRRPLRDNVQGGRLGKTDVDLEELFGEVRDKAKESGRLILWYIPQVAGSHMYRGAILDHYMDVAIWTDEAIVELVKRRFVPLRAACAKELITETKVNRWRVVEPAIVILDANGNELHAIQRIRTFNADFIAAALRSVLEKNSPGAPPEGASGDDLMKGGWFDAAAKKLADDPLKLAELRRSEGKIDEALGFLDAAAKKGADASAVATVRGRALLSAGRIKEAREALEKGASPEASYYLAHAERMLGHDDVANGIWAKLAESSAENRWGWRAAANTTIHKDQKAYGPAAVGFEDVLWSAAPAAGATTTRWERTPADLQDVAKRAVAWLLREQSAKGSWNDARYAYWPSPEIQPNVHMAVTGLACAALLEWREVDPARIGAALEAGEKYLLDENNMARGKNEEPYADAYRLLYLVRKHATLADAAAKKKSQEQMNAIVKKLAAIQDKSGNWAHEYPNPFCTAAVLQMLLLARKAGADVEEGVLSRGAEALKATRDDEGRQSYAAGGKGDNASNSSGRNAMCEAVLLELKATERKSFEAAMDQFWSFLDRRENVRVCDFHSDGELAGFFFYNNFFHTTEAASLLEEKAREEALAKAAAHLAKIPEIDGSFIDSHEMGKSYGTAMALLSLRNALRK